MEPLTPTGRVVLGMLRMGKRTGYEIKQLVDVSTRFFWAASYGQIYPELKRLDAQGLVVGTPQPGPYLSLDYGLGLHQWVIDWCRRTERRLERVASAGEARAGGRRRA